MADKREGIIAGAVVLVAVMATACSESPKKAETRKTPAPAAVPTSFVPEEPAAPVATITPPAGPVSFLDGEAAYQARKYGEAAQIFDRYI